MLTWACPDRRGGVPLHLWRLGLGYDTPELLEGATNLGFMILPNYRAWVVVASIVVCIATWFVIEKTKLGAICAPAPRTRVWSRPLASTCR